MKKIFTSIKEHSTLVLVILIMMLVASTVCLGDTSKTTITNDNGIITRKVDVYGDGKVVNNNRYDKYKSFYVSD